MSINHTNAVTITPFLLELKELMSKHSVTLSGYGYGYEVEDDVLMFESGNSFIELCNYGAISSCNIDEIIESVL
jgi:hypothetical protein